MKVYRLYISYRFLFSFSKQLKLPRQKVRSVPVTTSAIADC